MSIGAGHAAEGEVAESEVTLLLFYGAVGVLALLLFAMSLSVTGSRGVAPDESSHTLATAAARPVERPATNRAAVAPPSPPALEAPPLPYRYAGSWTEGRQVTVMLKSGERFVVVRRPGPVDAEYSVQAIGRDRILLKYRPSSVVVALNYARSGHAAESRTLLPDVSAPQQPKTDLVDN